jgi:hypothetical protein
MLLASLLHSKCALSVLVHLPWFVDKHGLCGVFGEDGGEAVHVTDSAAHNLVRQMKKIETRHKAHAPHPHRAHVYPAARAGHFTPGEAAPDCAAACPAYPSC